MMHRTAAAAAARAPAAPAAPAQTRLPHLIFIAPPPRAPRPSLCAAWRRAIARYFPDPNRAPRIDVVEGRLEDVDPARLRCDCLVSPANAFGIMDGG